MSENPTAPRARHDPDASPEAPALSSPLPQDRPISEAAPDTQVLGRIVIGPADAAPGWRGTDAEVTHPQVTPTATANAPRPSVAELRATVLPPRRDDEVVWAVPTPAAAMPRPTKSGPGDTAMVPTSVAAASVAPGSEVSGSAASAGEAAAGPSQATPPARPGAHPVRQQNVTRPLPVAAKAKPPTTRPEAARPLAGKLARTRMFKPNGAPVGGVPGDTTNRSQDPAAPAASAPRTNAMTWVMLAVIATLALYLRLREPLSSSIMGAEDPYRHVERTWDLMQGKFEASYPPGLNILLMPFAAMGPGVMYAVARFLPAVFGVSLVVGVFFLCRRYTHPVGAITAALLAAVMPETIRRTDILFPTALDLALLPWFFLATLLAVEGSKKAGIACGVLGLVFLFVHPWVVALMVPPVGLFWLITLWRKKPELRSKLLGATGAVAGLALLSVMLPPLNSMVFGHALPKLGTILTGGYTAPQFVEIPAMLTIPALVLAAVGIPIAFVRRTPFAILGLLIVAFTLPFVLVDWFDIWYIPHRTVVYMSIGVLMLSAMPIGELLGLIKESKPTAQRSITFGVVALSLVTTMPAGMGLEPWYRIYDDNDLAAWEDLDARGTTYLMAGSWESRTGYRAYTANDAQFNPEFFRNELQRSLALQEHPDMVVLIDKHTTQPPPEGQPDERLPTEFLDSWRPIGQWGDKVAYVPN